jgi:hypothetical protein
MQKFTSFQNRALNTCCFSSFNATENAWKHTTLDKTAYVLSSILCFFKFFRGIAAFLPASFLIFFDIRA